MRRVFCLSFVLALGLIGVSCSGGGGGGGTSPTAPPPANGDVVVVQVQDDYFQPKQVDIQPGETVRWVLRGSHPGHTTTARDGSWNSGSALQNVGDVYEHTFTTQDDGQTFEYYCSTHRGCCMMQGSVRVGASAPPPDSGYAN